MLAPIRRRATYADLEAVPDPMVAELVDGDLYSSPRPGTPHGHATFVLGVDLGATFQRGRGGPGGWFLMFEPELHLGEDVLVPDLSGWRRERMPAPPPTPAIALAPDWICEVLSDRTR